MAKVSTFFYSLKKTFISPAYYADILKAPFRFSLKFYYFYFILFAIIGTAIMTIRLLMPLNTFLKTLPKHLENIYPTELVITIQNGQASTNVKEPYFIPVSRIKPVIDELKNVLGENTEKIDNLLVIDTKATLESFSQYQTYALLTRTSLSYVNDNGNIETVPLKDTSDIVIDKFFVKNLVEKLSPMLENFLPLGIPLVFFFMILFLPSINFSYLLFFALILMVAAKIIVFNLSYKKSLQVGLHLIVVYTTVFSLLSLSGLSFNFPFLRTIILVIMAIFILNKIKAAQTQSPPAPNLPTPQPSTISSNQPLTN